MLSNIFVFCGFVLTYKKKREKVNEMLASNQSDIQILQNGNLSKLSTQFSAVSTDQCIPSLNYNDTDSEKRHPNGRGNISFELESNFNSKQNLFNSVFYKKNFENKDSQKINNIFNTGSVNMDFTESSGDDYHQISKNLNANSNSGIMNLSNESDINNCFKKVPSPEEVIKDILLIQKPSKILSNDNENFINSNMQHIRSLELMDIDISEFGNRSQSLIRPNNDSNLQKNETMNISSVNLTSLENFNNKNASAKNDLAYLSDDESSFRKKMTVYRKKNFNSIKVSDTAGACCSLENGIHDLKCPQKLKLIHAKNEIKYKIKNKLLVIEDAIKNKLNKENSCYKEYENLLNKIRLINAGIYNNFVKFNSRPSSDISTYQKILKSVDANELKLYYFSDLEELINICREFNIILTVLMRNIDYSIEFEGGFRDASIVRDVDFFKVKLKKIIFTKDQIIICPKIYS